MFLRENIEIDKDFFMKQNNVLCDESAHGTKLNSLATECTSKMKNNNSAGSYSKIDADWIQPKKSIPITCFFKKCKNQKENANVNNKHNVLIEEHDNEEEDDEETKHYEMKEEGSVTNKEKVDDREEMMSNDGEKNRNNKSS